MSIAVWNKINEAIEVQTKALAVADARIVALEQHIALLGSAVQSLEAAISILKRGKQQ